MAFSTRQLRALRRAPDHRRIRTREAHGREFAYLEGWYAISEANRIFGFDGWSRETVESRCVVARENRGAFIAVYTTKVRLTVQADGTTLTREGHGTGESHGGSLGEVHDTALKAAETDATKRALATFGKPFGLELYRSDKAQRSREPARVQSGDAAPSAALPNTGTNAQPAGASPPPAPPLQTDESPALQPDPGAHHKVTEAAEPRQSSFHPDDTTPIPRPSRYYGRRRDTLAEHFRTERRAAERQRADQHTRAPLTSPAPGKIDKSELAIGEPKRLRDRAHLRYVASQPCLICHRQPCDPHHLRFAQPRAIGMKVSDEFTVPLCRTHHRQLHQVGDERIWWTQHNISPLEIARTLWQSTHPASSLSNEASASAQNTPAE